jgi:hypothetical protein
MRYLAHGDAEFIDEVTSFFRVPISPRSQLQRNAEIDAYYALAVKKQRDLFAQLSPDRQASLSREIEQYRLRQMAIPGRVRLWLDRNRFSRSAAIRGMAFAKRVLKFTRRAAAFAFRPADPARFPQ